MKRNTSNIAGRISQPTQPYGLGLGGGVLRCPHFVRTFHPLMSTSPPIDVRVTDLTPLHFSCLSIHSYVCLYSFVVFTILIMDRVPVIFGHLTHLVVLTVRDTVRHETEQSLVQSSHSASVCLSQIA